MGSLALARLDLVELVVCAPLALVAAACATRFARGVLASRAAAALVALMLVAGLAFVPRQIARAASRADVRSTRCPQPGTPAGDGEAPRAAPAEIAALRVLRSRIPAADTYYLRSSSGIVRFCAFSWLLPRVAVSDAASADWVIVIGVEPRTVDAANAVLREVAPRTYLGRVRR